MACCLRVRGAAHSGGTRQARQSRHAASESIREDRPGSGAQLLLSTGGRARRRLRVVLGGHHLHSGADVVRHPNERGPDRTRLSRRRGTRRFEPVTPPPTRGGAPTGVRIVRGGVLENGRLRSGRSSTRSSGGRRASPSIAHRESAIWQRLCVVGKVRLSPRTAMDPGAGADEGAELAAGVRAGGLLHCPYGRWRRPGRVSYDTAAGLAA